MVDAAHLRPNLPSRAIAATLVAAGLVAGLSAGLAGCTTGNDRLGTGQASTGQNYEPAEVSGTNSGGLDGSERSVKAIGRSDWPLVNVLVPVDGVAASPAYTTTRMFTDSTARQRGEHETALTALELGGHTTWEQYGEIAFAPCQVGMDLVMMVPRMFSAGPGEEVPVMPASHWRAPVNISRVPYVDGTKATRPESSEPAAAPASTPSSNADTKSTNADRVNRRTSPSTAHTGSQPEMDDPAAAYDAPKKPAQPKN